MRIRLDIPLTSAEAACAMGGVCGSEETEITHICTDSRECGGKDLFFALVGRHGCGELYVDDAIKRGAIAVSKSAKVGVITVQSPENALLSLAKYYKTKLKKLKWTVGITGSVGKTTTKEFLRILTEKYYKTHATRENENNTIGVPLTILGAKKDTELLILEMGMNAYGEIRALSKCSSPDIAVITNIGTSHIGAFGGREGIAKAKLEIKEGMAGGELILPYGEELLMSEEATFFSARSRRADIYIIYNEGNLNIQDGTMHFSTSHKNLGRHNFECLCAAYAVCRKIGMSPESVISHFSEISEENTRQSIVSIKDFYILSDFYNSSYESVAAALDYMSERRGYKYRSALLGSILELGNQSVPIYERLGRLCAEKNLKNLYLYGADTEKIMESAIDYGMDRGRIFLYERGMASDMARVIYDNSLPCELILFKASNAVGLYEVLESLKALSEKNT